jgi:hypothetical protein
MLKKLGLSSLALALTASLALAGGVFSQFPILGVPDSTNCLSFGNNGVCNQYSPTGPTATTGNETILLDSNLPNGQQPSSFLAPLSSLQNSSQGAFRNALIGGDFNINLWQRGTTFTSATPTTAALTADRWFMYSSANTVTVSKQTGASDINAAVGMLATMRVNRPSGTDVTPICVGQIVPAKETARYLGNNAVFSFYAMAPTTLNSANDSIDVSIAYITAADSATPLTNTDAFAKSTATGYTAVVTKGNQNATNTTIASGVANIALNQTFTRYYVSGLIPTTATSIGVKICMTPAASTGASTDWFEFGNAQLEAAAATTTTNLGVVIPGSFSRRQPAIETALMQSYSYGLIEATGQFYNNTVLCVSSTNAQIGISFPSQMRIVPTVTVTAGGFSIQTAAAVTAIGTTTLVSATTQQAGLTSAAACTTTLPYVLKGTNTTGLLMFSAEP